MNKTDLLLQMMQQPQKYTAGEWQEILADRECRELYTLMSKTQSAIDAARADEEVTDEMIDAEWQRLTQPNSSLFTIHSSLFKFAAMFVSVLMLSGIAYAAIHVIATSWNKQQSVKTEIATNTRPSAVTPQQVETDSAQVPQPKLYDNIPLEQILTELSAYYHIKVEYSNDAVRQLRLFYQWRPDYSIAKVVEMLNNFETLQLQIENDTLIVSSTAEQ
ncbi:MAG: DUF4974 domain-containing protein [Prevotella sp.]|nr:DUF4974 domain-containing protein [Prevotella sp.]MBR0263836.1 DUF4974 domain-containing protein [Prevotella sp.]MBR1412596.1 DUF4974 domain-containing protein [Prevotella sp.]